MSDKPTHCSDCGSPLPPYAKGRPQLVCGECRRGRRRVKKRGPVICVDCAAVFAPPSQTGTLPMRCDDCRRVRQAVLDAEKSRRWRQANPEKDKESRAASSRKWLSDPANLKAKRERAAQQKYGLTADDLVAMLDQQDHLCAICRQPHVGKGTRLHVDHNHQTGKVRALLCSRCNTMLGLASESPERLELAAAYLRHHNT
jgi:phage FluMu protein Com